ncbi:hypothetical protein Pfo_015709 [Paulownia fortunei]|nr:hypothetical protein Pfo_015709 [Paulownia fortunei]
MADAAISFAVQKLGDLLIQKVAFLQGVEEKVKWLKDELERMQCFLEDAAEKQAKEKGIHKWLSDIRKVAQDAEDVIETFILNIDTPRRSRGLLGRCGGYPNHVYHLNRVGIEIESIRTRLQDIDNSRQRYGIQILGEGMAMSPTSEEVERLRRLPHWQKGKHVVGLEKDVELLLQKAILEKRKGLSIATIVGMGGIGKSTLARIVYNHAAVADRFDCRAWVVVSSEFRPKEIIKELLLQLLEPTEDKAKVLETTEKLQVPNLQQILHQRLTGKRYFIVLDDVWTEAQWQSLASAFPDEDKGSRLLLTSRSRDIPSCARYVHEMKLLDPNESWELFLKTAFIDNTDGKCPQDLENIGREILEKCDGLPLAITVVGGLLVKQRQTKSGWQKVLKGMDSYLGRSTDSDNVSAILELSYQNLPPQLKSSFLCLGFFKKDTTIRAKKLVQVWIAEGLVPQQGVGGEEKVTMEEIARSYLDELINRSMVQVKDMSKGDRVKNCHIHSHLRELSIRKAKEEISFEILMEGDSQSLNEPRHRAIYCSTERFIYSANPNKHLRSLFFNGAGVTDGTPSYWKSFGLLRVLDFEDFGLKELPDTIGLLIGLRYLGLRHTRIRKLPSSLGCLKNLQVLDLSWNFMMGVPNVIWKMDSLRHLYMSDIICKTPLRIDTLKNLQTLAYIDVDNWKTGHLKQMTSLRKLGIKLDSFSNVGKLYESLSTLENLVCLKLICRRYRYYQSNAFLDGIDVLERLTELKLFGKMGTLPKAEKFPPILSYLDLTSTFLQADPMPVLQNLPNLLFLKLDNAYNGDKMVIPHSPRKDDSPRNDGFPKLKVLSLRRLEQLRNIQFGKGAMPELKQLEIYNCRNLESLPEELRFMTNLQELKMVTTAEMASKLRGVDSHIISNIPSVHLIGH